MISCVKGMGMMDRITSSSNLVSAVLWVGGGERAWGSTCRCKLRWGMIFFPFQMACSACTCLLLGERGKYVYSFISLLLEVFQEKWCWARLMGRTANTRRSSVMQNTVVLMQHHSCFHICVGELESSFFGELEGSRVSDHDVGIHCQLPVLFK